MDRRLFLKLTAFVAAAGALPASRVAAQTAEALDTGTPVGLQPPGMYQITGRVSLEAPVVEITGITNAQQISWAGGQAPVAGFSSFEVFDRPWQMADISVRGGKLQALAVTPMELG